MVMLYTLRMETSSEFGTIGTNKRDLIYIVHSSHKVCAVLPSTEPSSGYYCNFCLSFNTRSDVAILYNDRSVLENHHVSAAYKLMQEEEMNILTHLNKDDWR